MILILVTSGLNDLCYLSTSLGWIFNSARVYILPKVSLVRQMKMEKIITCGHTRSWRSASMATELLM